MTCMAGVKMNVTAVSRGNENKYDGSWPQPRRIGRREVEGISVGFGMVCPYWHGGTDTDFLCSVFSVKDCLSSFHFYDGEGERLYLCWPR